MDKIEEEINQEWKTFVIDNNIGDDLKSFCKGQEEKGRFNGLDILNLIENISIRFAKSIPNLIDANVKIIKENYEIIRCKRER